MKYTKLGRTGIDVSRICLGCMSYGGGNLGNHAWSLPEEESRPFIKKALEAGINFFDTANRYSLGSSEEILGRAVKDFARRDEVVIATKVYRRGRAGPHGRGPARAGGRGPGGARPTRARAPHRLPPSNSPPGPRGPHAERT